MHSSFWVLSYKGEHLPCLCLRPCVSVAAVKILGFCSWSPPWWCVGLISAAAHQTAPQSAAILAEFMDWPLDSALELHTCHYHKGVCVGDSNAINPTTQMRFSGSCPDTGKPKSEKHGLLVTSHNNYVFVKVRYASIRGHHNLSDWTQLTGGFLFKTLPSMYVSEARDLMHTF